VTDNPSRPSLRKGGAASGSPAAKAAPPRLVLYAAVALVVSGVAAMLASLALLLGSVEQQIRDRFRNSLSDDLLDKLDDARKAGPSGGSRGAQLDTLRDQFRALKQTASDRLTPKLGELYSSVAQLKPGASAKGKPLFDDLKKQLDDIKKLSDTVASQQKGLLLSSLVVLIALGLAAAAAYRGKYWARWAIVGLWVLSSITGATLVGISSLLSVAADLPLLFKLPAFVAALALVVAVVLINLRPSTTYLNQSRPARPGGTAQRRGLFSPRPPASATSTKASTKASTKTSTKTSAKTSQPAETKPAAAADRARAKQRTGSDAAAAAKGAELARQRAKAANKSRRTGS
jgi:hypothetical protein